MLEALRKSATGWVAKLFIGLLVLSFAVWGVADIFRGYRGTDVAEVGDTPITIEEYRAALQREIQRVSRQAGSYLTMDQARAMGLDGRVLGQMMAEAALDDEAASRGLGITDEVVAESISADPSFRTPGGQFDRTYFEQVLRATGYSEGLYVAEQRKRILRNMIADAVGGAIAAPEVLERAIDRYRNETRSAEFVVVTPAMVGEVTAPTEEELRTYFDDNKTEFRAPEYRKLGVIAIDPAGLAAALDIPEADLKASFDADPGRFGTPERRTIERIVFDTMDAARQAKAEIDGGKSFEDVARERGMSEPDLNLGTLAEADVLDQAIADTAFALDPLQVSDPVEGNFGPVIVRVTAVEPGTVASFEAVRDGILQVLAQGQAADRILDIYDAIEDDRAAGMTLAEIAQKHDLEYVQVDSVDRSGLTPDGQRAAGLPETPRLLVEAFTTEPGFEADPVQTPGDGWAWYEVQDVTPARDLSFEEARERVASAWRTEKTQDLVRDKARDLADRVRGGTGFFALAEELGTTSGLVGPIRRNARDGEFGAPAVQLMFTTPRGEVATTVAGSPGARLVFRVTEVTVPEFTPSDDGDQVSADLVNGISNDILGQYLAELEARIGVSINQEALRLALGEAEP